MVSSPFSSRRRQWTGGCGEQVVGQPFTQFPQQLSHHTTQPAAAFQHHPTQPTPIPPAGSSYSWLYHLTSGVNNPSTKLLCYQVLTRTKGPLGHAIGKCPKGWVNPWGICPEGFTPRPKGSASAPRAGYPWVRVTPRCLEC